MVMRMTWLPLARRCSVELPTLPLLSRCRDVHCCVCAAEQHVCAEYRLLRVGHLCPGGSCIGWPSIVLDRCNVPAMRPLVNDDDGTCLLTGKRAGAASSSMLFAAVVSSRWQRR